MAKGGNTKGITPMDYAGADPMGIGVGDPRQLTSDYWRTFEQVSRPFRETAARRRQEAQQRRQEYQQLLKELPTVEGLSASASEDLNQDIAKARQLYEKRMLAGPFFSLARTEEGKSAQEELGRLQRDIAQKKSKYDFVLQNMGPQLQYIANPLNQDKLNQKRTRENVAAFNKMSLDEQHEAIASGQPLAVVKPEPQDLYAYVGDIMDTVRQAGGVTKTATYETDPASGLYTIRTESVQDPNLVHRNFVAGYRAAPAPMRDYIDEEYDKAPEASKLTKDGTKMPVEDWFANQFSGLFGKNVAETVQKMPTDKTKKGYRGVGRDRQGGILLGDMRKQTVMRAPMERQTTTVRRQKKDGTYVYRKAGEYEPGRMEATYNTVEIPLASVDESFDGYTQTGTIETYTGDSPATGLATKNDPISVVFYPVYNGPEEVFTEQSVDPKTGEKYSDKFTLKPGDQIPSQYEERVDKRFVKYEPYLMTKSIYGAAIEVPQGMSWKDYISSHGKTLITPWGTTKQQYYAKLRGKGFTEAEIMMIEKDVNDTYGQLNPTLNPGQTFPPPPADDDLDEVVDDIFGL